MSAPVKAAPIPLPLGKFGGHIGVARQLLEWTQQGRAWYRERTRWTVSVTSTDRLYDAAHSWFLESEMGGPPKALSARLRYGSYGKGQLISSGDQEAASVELYYDVKVRRTVRIDGHEVQVSIEKPGTVGPGTGDDSWGRMVIPDALVFSAQSHEGQQAVVAMLRELGTRQDRRRPALHLLNSWGEWTRRDDLPERSLDSVVLAQGQMERLRDDLQRFLDDEPDYVRRGIPWHRGILLHGPAGTGKTSAVRALAAHFGLDLWYAPLGDLTKDAKLLNLIAAVGPRSILLLEDVDIFHAARERDDEQSGLSMAGLLNALDGVATPHGMITVLTTNDLSVIDESLLRPGRVDLIELVGHPEPDQIERLWAGFFELDRSIAAGVGERFKGSAAEAAEVCKRHMHDPMAALDALGW